MTDEEDEEERRRRIIIRTASDSKSLNADERAFLLDVAMTVESGGSVHFLDRYRVGRLLRRAALG